MDTKTAILDLGVVTGFDENRCDVCSWPLVETIKEGCTLGNCSQRGELWERNIEDSRVWINAKRGLRHLIAEVRRMERVRLAAEAYNRDPVNADDRPASWGLLDELLSAILDAPSADGL
jgi:hypothetical protein